MVQKPPQKAREAFFLAVAMFLLKENIDMVPGV